MVLAGQARITLYQEKTLRQVLEKVMNIKWVADLASDELSFDKKLR